MSYFNFSLEPGKRILNKNRYEENRIVISVIIPFYNSKKYIEQTIISVLNQTFPYFEILIIDDGSTDKESLEKLEEVRKLDSRIKIYHKNNEGLASTRDYGAKKASEASKYLMFLDDDDLIEPTFLECAYWTLETNREATWAYTDSVGFQTQEYTWNKYFNSEKLKKENELISEALIRKEDFFIVNGYNLKEKGVNEDWNFWLKLLSKDKYPVHMSFYAQWYRRKETGELKKSKDNRKRSLEIINETAKNLNKEVKAIQYPKYDYNYEIIKDKFEGIIIPKKIEEKNKINLLFIIPWMIVGGADFFNLNLVKGLNKDKYNITIITTEPNKNVLRQRFEENDNVIVYDLTSFLDQKYWIAFINYIIEKENINLIMNSNSKFGYAILPYIKSMYPHIPIIDYIHMEEWYNRNGGYSRYSSMYSSVIDKTLVCNGNSKKILENYFNRDEEDIKTIYIGVDEKRFDPDKYNKNELKKKYLGENSNKDVISFICRISEQKRPMLLLKIIDKLKTTRNNFKVIVAGSGNLLDKIKEETSKLGLENEIIFVGEIKDTAEIYKISDLTINCSIKEGLALTSYESLSMDIPVISSDVGGQKELINSDVGEIVELMQKEEDIHLEQYDEKEINDFVNGINKILDNKELYKGKCRERICKYFTIDKMIENMEDIFENTYLSPNEEKIKNGERLSKNINITKEIITSNIHSDKNEYKWECYEYEKNVYGRPFSSEGFNYKRELLKEKLWKIGLFRLAIKIRRKILKI